MKLSVCCLVLILFTTSVLGKNMKVDPHSHANIEEARVTNVSLELDINFEDHVLNGSVVLSVERVKPETKTIVSLLMVLIQSI